MHCFPGVCLRRAIAAGGWQLLVVMLTMPLVEVAPIDLLATADCDRIACFSLLHTAVGDNLPVCGDIDNACQKIATPTSPDTPPCGNAIAAE